MPRIKPWILITLVGFITFANSLFNSFVLEDKAEIIRNLSVHSFSNIPNLFIHQVGGQESLGYYRPILFTFYTTLYSLFGEVSFPYHLLQIAIQIGNALLIYLIFKKFIKGNIALVIALLFLVHPINEESVVWITNLQEVLFVFFGLLSIYFLQKKELSLKIILATNILLLLSVLSKETGVLFGAVAILYVYLFHKKDFFIYSFFTVITGLIYLVLRLASQIPFQKEALVPIMRLSFFDRMLQVPSVISYYFTTFIFPKDLVVYHSKVIRTISVGNFYLPLLVDILGLTIIVLITAFIIKKKKNIKLTIFFLIWFLIGLLFHLQIIPLDFTVADHFFLFSFIGLMGFLGLYLHSLSLQNLNNKYLLIIITILLFLLWGRTVVRNTDWRDQKTLITHDENVEKNDYLLELVYTTQLVQDNQLEKALIHINHAIELYPQSYTAWSSLGVIYYDQGNIDKAKDAFNHSIRLGTTFGTYENMGLLLLKHGKLSTANQFLRDATIRFPNSKKLWYYRLISEYKSGNYSDALLSSKNYYLLQQDQQSYTIYTYLSQNKKLNIEF